MKRWDLNDRLNPDTLTALEMHEVDLKEGNAITTTEAFLAVKTLKAAGFDEVRPEMFKALNQEVLWQTRVCQVAWCSGRSLID